MRRLTPVRVSSLRSCSYGEGCFPTPLRRRGLLMIHLGCEKGLERPFSLFCHFRAAQAFELGKLPPDRWHRGEVRSHVRFRPYRPGIRWAIPGPEGPGFVL